MFENRGQVTWLAIALTIAVLQLSACTVGPKYHPPAMQAPPAYKEVGNWKPAQSPSAIREKFSSNRGTTTISNGKTINDFVLPLDLSYQADVWGRVRRNVESYREQAQASAADLAVVNLSMHADLAIDYFAARTLDAEEQLLQYTVVQYEKALQLNEERFRGGIASEVEVEQARTILETTRAQAIDVGVARAQYEHAVAVLVGKPPAEFTLPPLPLTTPPPSIPVGLPSELLERRPDIAAAERRVASANAQVGLAKRTLRSGWPRPPTILCLRWQQREGLRAAGLARYCKVQAFCGQRARRLW